MAKRTNPLAQLSAHWGRGRVAKRFGVTPATVARWERNGLPASRRREVEATVRRVDQARERAALNDDWAREILTRWVEAGNEETDAMIRIRELSIRKRQSTRDRMAIETWKGLLADSTEYRRQLGKQLNSRRFRNTPTGRDVSKVTAEVDTYASRYREAIERDKPREISDAWKAWERQVSKLADKLSDLQIPGMSKRQVYTLFFSP